MLSLLNYSVGGVTLGVPDYLIRQIEAADAETMEKLVAADSAAVVALNANQAPANQWTPADANLAGGGDGHTFVFTATYLRRSLNIGTPFLAQFVDNLLTTVSVNPGNPPLPPPVTVLAYPLPVPNNVYLTPGFVPGPEFFIQKFCLAAAEQEIKKAFDDMIARAIFATGNAIAPAFWQQLVGAAKGTRFMGGVSVFQFQQGR